MRSFWLALTLVLAVFVPGSWGATPVVVELFTSEGCSSCPPADALLIQLGQTKAPNGSEILILAEHVDYWNHDGWTDRFSSQAFTQRQQHYAERFRLNSPYTPQMVVDGTLQFVGNDASKVSQAILQQSAKPKPVSVTLKLEGDKTLHIATQTAGPSKAHLIAAITEDSLTTEVAKGENGGRTLHHGGVVRNFRDLGKMPEGGGDKVITLPQQPGWNAANLKVVVWVQEPDYGAITGAASLSLAPNSMTSSQAYAK